MSIQWEIEKVLKEQNINNASQLKNLLENELGISISRQSLHKFIKNKPSSLKVETVQAICDLLGVESNEFMSIKPEQRIKTSNTVKKLYKKDNQSVFSQSDPRNFLK